MFPMRSVSGHRDMFGQIRKRNCPFVFQPRSVFDLLLNAIDDLAIWLHVPFEGIERGPVHMGNRTLARPRAFRPLPGRRS